MDSPVKKSAKRKALPKKGAYYLANKERMDAAKRKSDQNRLALRKKQKSLVTQKGREERRLHQSVFECKYYITEPNCSKDRRCKWSPNYKPPQPKCRSKQKNKWTVYDPEKKGKTKAKKAPAMKISLKKQSGGKIVEHFKSKNGRNMVRFSNGRTQFV